MKSWVWILTIVLTVATVCILVWKPPQNSSEIAAWFQVIGSVLALFAVLWLAHTDALQRRDEQLAQAAVTAAVLGSTLPYAITTMRDMASLLWDERNHKELGSLLVELKQSLDHLPMPSEEQMLRLVPYGHEFISRFAQSIAYTKQTQSIAAQMIDDYERVGQVGKGLDAMQQILRTAQNNLKSSIEELDRHRLEHQRAKRLFQ